jgi:hypothetical protein
MVGLRVGASVTHLNGEKEYKDTHVEKAEISCLVMVKMVRWDLSK